MGIYRGPGGTGDAVNDASSEALITVQAKDAALAAQAAAEAAQAAAELAETNAETAETNAETAETNAETAATNAANSASAASTSASNAASSASAASTSASNASTSASNAASSASAASTSASNAASSASTAATQATNASNSASAASTSATNASNSASAAATSATNAANSATAAQTAQTAAELAETNAETAETNAETAATNASNSASAAATSATNASNSASAASTSATNASNSASAAATSATNASNSASAASTSASNAATSESNAASSATAAAASYDSFDDRYLGAKSSAPTLDNDGNALLTGALYFNTSTNEMKVWSGSAWLNAYASLSGALLATNNLSDLNNTATARDNLGVEIGVDVQAYDAQLADIAGLTPTDNNFIVGNGTNFVTESGSTARTSLGLGSIATQDANNVAVTGGSINGTTVGASTPSTGSFTSLTDSGNLTFTGTGNRITGDFSNATTSNRVSFQTSTTNGITVAQALPNGTATQSNFILYNTSTPDTDFANLNIFITSGQATIRSGTGGAGTAVPLTFQTSNTERLRIDTSGNVGIGTSSPSHILDVSNTSATNKTFRIGQSSGSATASSTVIISNGGTGDAMLRFDYEGTNTDRARIGVTASNQALEFFTAGNNERMRIDSSGNVSVGTTTNGTQNDRYITIYGTNNPTLSLRNAGSGTGNNTGFDAFLAGGSSETNLYVRGNNAMVFGTNNTERMRITSGGDIRFTWSNNSFAGFYFDSTYYQGMTNGATARELYIDNRSNDTRADIVFRTGLNTSVTERMRIDSSGNVGIGCTPSAVGAYRVLELNNTTGGMMYMQANGSRVLQIYGAASESGIYNVGSSPLAFGTANTERMRITSGGDVVVGGTTAITRQTIYSDGSAISQLGAYDTRSFASGVGGVLTLGGKFNTAGQYADFAYVTGIKENATDGNFAGALTFQTRPNGSGPAERMRITSSGNVGIGTSSPNSILHLSSVLPILTWTDTDDSASTRVYQDNESFVIDVDNANAKASSTLQFRIDGSERMRLDSQGSILINNVGTPHSQNSVGACKIYGTGSGTDVVGLISCARSNDPPLLVNRVGNDGNLVEFYQAGTVEGSISVAGTTVSYNGGNLSRWAQMLTKPELLKGTVMSNLDEMNEYVDAEGNPVENEQLNKVKVSDVEGDVNVAGVFVNWSHDEAHNVDEINMAMTGDMIIRIAEGVVIQKGDLLMSAGDGTAKPQGDDIVRSKTIAKVTSNHVTCTYADGSYCVPCVLMAC